MLIDTHCHLDHLSNPTEKILKARNNNVNIIISPGVNASSSKKCLKIAQENKGVFSAAGLHPIDINSSKISLQEQLRTIANLLEKEKQYIVALGECGLDFGPVNDGESKRSKQLQIDILQKQIELALKNDLPLILHNRKANQELLNLLKPYKGKIKGVFHCFTGSKKFLQQVIDLDFYIGITGLITYDQGLQQVIKQAPESKLLIETDAPYLMPEPIRKTKKWPNEPKNVKIVAQEIAKVKGVCFDKIAETTTKNAIQLFKLKW